MKNDDDFLNELSNLPTKIKEGHQIVDIEDINLETSEDPTLSDDFDINTEPETKSEIVPNNDLVPELNSEQLPEPVKTQGNPRDISTPPPPNATQEYIIDSGKKIIQQGFDTLQNIQDTIISTVDGKAINGYASLVQSLGKVLDTMNSIAMNQQRMEHQMKLEDKKFENRMKGKAAQTQQPVTKNTINIVAGREEIMKMLENV